MTAELILERGLWMVKERPLPPLLVLAWLGKKWFPVDSPRLAKAHAQAMTTLMDVAGGDLCGWWESTWRTQREVVELFEEALFRVQTSPA